MILIIIGFVITLLGLLFIICAGLIPIHNWNDIHKSTMLNVIGLMFNGIGMMCLVIGQ